ncbi:MAG TPA: PAS domain S-box protein [Gemmatimonadales bacterium]|nr:PAS domain S-box protein [Gemmatimonadales bacterium]
MATSVAPSAWSVDIRILVLAPTPADARLTSRVLQDAGMQVQVCEGMADLCREIGSDGGLVLLTEEAVADHPRDLAEALENQPPWSDLPVLLLADQGADAAVAAWAMDNLGNVTVLDRPVRVVTLVSALRTGLRARRRQYELRDLLERSSLLAAIVQSSDDAIIGQDLDGVIRSWNAGAERLFGYPRTAVVGRPLAFLLPPDRQAADHAAQSRLRERGHAERFETVFLARDQRAVDVAVTLSTVCDADGRAVGVSRIVRDIGDLKRAEAGMRESEERFRLMADAAPVLIWLSDRTGGYTWFNRPWLEFTGRAFDEEVGDGWAQGVHPDDCARCLETYRGALAEREPFQMDYRLRRHDGVYRWLLDTGRPLRDPRGDFIGYIGSCVDITERREVTEVLRQADRRKDEFLATLGHELRNPLSPIRNGLHILRLNADADARERLVGMMERQVDHLVRLVDDLLEVSRISRGKVELRRARVELAPIVHGAIEACRPLLQQERHQLVVELPPEPIELEADAVRLTQVVANLLNNAAKYTEPGGHIRLSARVLDGEVELSVRDSGVGIPPEMLPEVFEMFAQVNRTLGRSQGGLGIGLALVRHLVELHGGSVNAHSGGDGMGSEFVVRLPLAGGRPPVDPTDLVRGTEAAASARRVLVVDDNADAAESLAQLLMLKGHEVRVAYDGLSGVEIARAFAPDVVLLDIGMPGLDGYAVARRLRQQDGAPPMRLVALTGYGQEDDRRRALDAGFDGHLVKPPAVASLDDVLRGTEAPRGR